MFDLSSLVGASFVVLGGVGLYLHALFAPPGPRQSYAGMFWIFWSAPAFAGAGLFYLIDPVYLFSILCLYTGIITVVAVRLPKVHPFRPGYVFCARCAYMIKIETSATALPSIRCPECGCSKWYGIRKNTGLSLNPVQYSNYGHAWLNTKGAWLAFFIISFFYAAPIFVITFITDRLDGIDPSLRNTISTGIWLISAWFGGYLASMIALTDSKTRIGKQSR